LWATFLIRAQSVLGPLLLALSLVTWLVGLVALALGQRALNYLQKRFKAATRHLPLATAIARRLKPHSVLIGRDVLLAREAKDKARITLYHLLPINLTICAAFAILLLTLTRLISCCSDVYGKDLNSFAILLALIAACMAIMTLTYKTVIDLDFAEGMIRQSRHLFFCRLRDSSAQLSDTVKITYDVSTDAAGEVVEKCRITTSAGGQMELYNSLPLAKTLADCLTHRGISCEAAMSWSTQPSSNECGPAQEKPSSEHP